MAKGEKGGKKWAKEENATVFSLVSTIVLCKWLFGAI